MPFNHVKKGLLLLVLMLSPTAWAIPLMQLYVEGGTYDAQSETWVVEENQFTLWVIGNTGAKGPITGANGVGGVSLVVSVLGGNLSGLSITPATVGCCGVIDNSLASMPISTLSGAGQHHVLASHGIFNQPGVLWQQFDLGVFNLTDSLIGDATQGGWPTGAAGNFPGQINAYHVTMQGAFDFLHFDGFGYINDGGKYVFAPFSHDAEATPPTTVITEVPAPATLPILMLGGLVLLMRRTKC